MILSRHLITAPLRGLPKETLKVSLGYIVIHLLIINGFKFLLELSFVFMNSLLIQTLEY